MIFERNSFSFSPASLNGGSPFEIKRPRVVTLEEHRQEITNHNKYHRNIARTLESGNATMLDFQSFLVRLVNSFFGTYGRNDK